MPRKKKMPSDYTKEIADQEIEAFITWAGPKLDTAIEELRAKAKVVPIASHPNYYGKPHGR